jgi:glutathione S-transferase
MIKSHILIGQYDSPFVRRVAVTLHHYSVAFERRVLSKFADFDTMLELGHWERCRCSCCQTARPCDSRATLDFLHGQASPERLLLPRHEPARYRVWRAEVTALGLAEKT